jgi:hypothetical protein
MIYLLTAIGLILGGSSTVQYSTVQYSTHLHTNNTQKNTINLVRVRTVPHLCELYLGIRLTTEVKTRKTLSKGSRRVPAVTMKTEYTDNINDLFQFDVYDF